MILDIVAIILLLWFLGIIQIPGFSINNIVILYFNGKPITLAQVFIFFIIMLMLGVLPSPIKQIAAAIFVIWILSVVGIITVTGLSNILIVGIIIGLIASMFRDYFSG
jgi:hypothetical protein